jgi:hypothetical protein
MPGRVTEIHGPCWSCGYTHDATSALDGDNAIPEPGDVSVCLACGEVAIFAVIMGRLGTREPTRAEREDANHNRGVVTARLIQREARERDPAWPHGPRE